jgi:(R,R)-butanediol dehydrogenase/meso-butanediol dehydrogenase/diacetyl reductase
MRAAVLEGKRSFVVSEVPEPVLNSDEVLVKVRCCGICGGDLTVYKQGAAVGFGHEYSGEVVEVGPDVKGWAKGNRVAFEPNVSCGECFWCRQGDIGLCEQYYVGLIQFRGGFATYTAVKQDNLHRLPDEMSYEQGALVEPTTCAVHAVELSGMRQGDVVAVLGLGPIGQLVARVARVLGAGAVYASEISGTRIELAKGAMDEVIDANLVNPVDRILELTDGVGPDIVFECAGSVATSQQSVMLVRKAGTVVVEAICFDPVELVFNSIVLKGLTIKGSQCFRPGDYSRALTLVEEGKVDVSPLVTHKFALDDINEAFDTALKAEGGKILVEP